jgi:hypothetical protein
MNRTKQLINTIINELTDNQIRSLQIGLNKQLAQRMTNNERARIGILRPNAKFPYEPTNNIPLTPHQLRLAQIQENERVARNLANKLKPSKILRPNAKFPYAPTNNIVSGANELQRREQIKENAKIAKQLNNQRKQNEANAQFAQNLNRAQRRNNKY